MVFGKQPDDVERVTKACCWINDFTERLKREVENLRALEAEMDEKTKIYNGLYCKLQSSLNPAEKLLEVVSP